MVKRLLTTVIVTSLVTAGSLVATAGPGHTAVSCTGSTASFDGGTGTVADPLKISTQAQLELLHGLTYMTCNYLQTADITLTGTWAPIGEHNDYFTGVYDGGGHSISGLNVTAGSASGGGQLLGLFGKIKGVGGVPAQVKRLTIAGTITKSSGNFVGGLAGQVENTLLTDVSSSVVVSVSDNAGGLVGQATGVTATRVFATGDVTGSNASATAIGGLFGILRGTVAQPDVVQDAYATGLVTAGTSSNGVGGLVGLLSSSPKVTFTNVYAIGHLTGGDGSVTQCFGGGMMGPPMCVTTTGTRGGILAPINTGPTYGADFAITNSSALWNTQTTGAATTAENKGTGKTTVQLKSFDTYDQLGWSIGRGYNVNKTWGICQSVNNGYPFLIWQYSVAPCGPVPTAVTPSSGDPAGGTTVELTGSRMTDVTAVTFGGVNAQSFTVDSATKITAVTPAGAAGSADVVLTDTEGNSTTLVAGWTFLAPSSTPTAEEPTNSSGTTAESARPAPSVVSSTPQSDHQGLSRRDARRQVLAQLPTKQLIAGLNVLLKKPVTISDGTLMRPKVRLISPQTLLPTGEVTVASRAFVSPSGKVRIFIGTPKPSRVLLTLTSAVPINGKTLTVRSVYRVK